MSDNVIRARYSPFFHDSCLNCNFVVKDSRGIHTSCRLLFVRKYVKLQKKNVVALRLSSGSNDTTFLGTFHLESAIVIAKVIINMWKTREILLSNVLSCSVRERDGIILRELVPKGFSFRIVTKSMLIVL